MADQLLTTKYYQMKGGIDLKVSLYEMNTARFLDIRNMDFDTPNALSRRQGSTQASSNSLSGPVIALTEFQKLTGESWVVAHDSTALWFLGSGGAFTLLATTGWSLNQPADTEIFDNRLFVVNGNTAINWDGNTVLPLGLPCPMTSPTFAGCSVNLSAGATVWTVFGSFTMAMNIAIGTWQGVAVFAAYSYVRTDGYYGPLDFYSYAKNILGQSLGFPATYTNADVTSLVISGLTAPTGAGITSIAIWLSVVPWTAGNYVNTFGHAPFAIPGDSIGQTLATTNNLTNFYLYTTIPASSQTYTINFGGVAFSAVALSFDNNQQFSGMPFCWFNTNAPKYVELANTEMVYAGFSATPSSVWIADDLEPEVINILSEIEVRTNDSDRIYGVKQFNNNIMVFKERSFHEIIGTITQGFELFEVSNQYGCISNKSIVQYKQKLLWLDRKGIVEYNGASFDLISNEIEPIFRRMNLTAAYEKACAVHHLFRSQIWFGIPVDGSLVNNLTVVFDYLVGAWTFFDGFNPSSFGFNKAYLNKQTVWRGDYSGLVFYHGDTFTVDNGRQFTCLAKSRFEMIGGENQTNLWRRFFLDVEPVAGVTVPINLQFFSNYDQTTVQATGTALGSTFQTRIETGINAKSVAVQFALYATYALQVNGYAWANRPLRNV